MQIRIHNEGWVYFISLLIITIITLPFFPFIGLILFLITVYIFYFFRDPMRNIPNEDFVVSPADGTVTFIGKAFPPLNNTNNNECLKISIFLNIFNVHVNRIPCSGVIKKINYIHGKFINATLDKSSTNNERNIICLKKNNNDIIYITQIAGLIARRIVCDVRVNQEVIQGHRFGIIKFGSRVDLYLPADYKILISKGQIMVGGETIISNPNNISQVNNSLKN